MKKSAWRFSANGSTIEFKIKYYKISNIAGCFAGFEGKVLADDSFIDVEVDLSLDVASINANNQRRNRKLRSRECLHIKQFPNVYFKALSGCKLSEGKIRELTGTLTIKDISREITLITNYSHIKKGNDVPTMVFSLFGCINRKDFMLLMEDDKLDDEIHLSAQLEMTKAF
ncbi:YceI family protein [Mucilaginibacter sp.]|jgi:polyisoprenoid-binding protein YceI|uniref:YceI family protein n=1 Tax=Mucilaginibacter sp. TaxID=1882438 RepID=UPI003562A5C9